MGIEHAKRKSIMHILGQNRSISCHRNEINIMLKESLGNGLGKALAVKRLAERPSIDLQYGSPVPRSNL